MIKIMKIVTKKKKEKKTYDKFVAEGNNQKEENGSINQKSKKV